MRNAAKTKSSRAILPKARTEVDTSNGWSPEEIYYVAERAYGLFREGRVERAAVLLSGLIAVDPANTYCRRALAAMYALKGECGIAVQHLNVILAHHEDDVAALACRCDALLRMHDFERAQKDLERIATLPGGLGPARRLAARLEFALGRPHNSQLRAGRSR